MLRTMLCLALLAAPALAQCDDCPMHEGKKSEAKAAVAPKIVLAVSGAETDAARVEIARGIEFVLGLVADSLAFDAEGRLPIAIGEGKRVQLAELATALERIPTGGATYAIDDTRTTLSGPVRLEVTGLHCDGCAGKVAGRLEGAGSDIAVKRDGEAATVALSADGLAVADLRKKFDGTHFELGGIAVGAFEACPESGCDAPGGCCKKKS